MEEFLLVARNITQAQHMAAVLARGGLRARCAAHALGAVRERLQPRGASAGADGGAGAGASGGGEADAAAGLWSARRRAMRRWADDLSRCGRDDARKAGLRARGDGPRGADDDLARPRRHSAVRLAEQTAFRCRSEAAALFGAARPEQVIFTQNATHGLNIAIRTLVRPGSRVAISGYEHNAVTRVLHSIPDVVVTVVDAPLFDPDAMAEGFAQALAQGADAGRLQSRLERVRGRRTRRGDCGALPRAGRAADRGRVAVGGRAGGEPHRLGRGIRGDAGAQGALRPAGDGTAAVRRGGGAASLRRDGEPVAAAGDAAGSP